MFSIKSSFQWLGAKVEKAVLGDVDERLRRGGAEWQAISRALAPKDTGFLASQETYTVANHTLTLHLGAFYDIFQEFGTRFIRPHPHVRPALNAIGRMWGGNIEMDFAVPFIASPIYASAGRNAGVRPVHFAVPKHLTPRQRAHVKQHLMPTSARLHKGNVARAKFKRHRIP